MNNEFADYCNEMRQYDELYPEIMDLLKKGGEN